MQVTKKYKVTLETKSPFRIGGKRDPFSSLDQPIVRIGDRVVVPGTSLKGAIREEMERYIIKNHADENNLKPCIPSSERMLSDDERKLIQEGAYRGASCHYPCDHEKEHSTKHSICPVCYLLGAQGLVGFVTVPFLYASVTSGELPATRIDRVTRTVAEGTHRFYQIIPAGVKFEGMMTVIFEDKLRKWYLGNPRPLQGNTQGDSWLTSAGWDKDKIVKDLIIDRVQSVGILGGLRSSGAGEVAITVHV
jgi:CRISPR/Cas system CSM-associated protein Csm3 (group 7 of RAMP superfamily)